MNAFERELVKAVREMADEVLVELVADHIDRVLSSPQRPVKAPRSDKGKPRIRRGKIVVFNDISHQLLTYMGKRYLLWRTQKAWFIQDEKSRLLKKQYNTKVASETEEGAREALMKTVR